MEWNWIGRACFSTEYKTICLKKPVSTFCFQHMIADMVRLIRQCQKDHMGQYFNCLYFVISFLQTSILKAMMKHHFSKLSSSVFARQITKSVSKVTYIHDPLAPAHCLTWFHTMALSKSTKSISPSKVTRFLFILGNGITQKSSSEVRAYIDYLHIIDNQQTLFELSQRLEPRS